MSAYFSVEDLARVSLPDRGERGWLVMLEAYLDDSGTHDRSSVVVWGGIAGHKYYLDQLDAAWRAQLLSPCEGKPPIKKFRSYDLEHGDGDGEFQGYNQGERDLTRRNFRQIVVNAGVSVLAYGVSIKDWDQLVRAGRPRQRDFTAEQAVFGKAVWEIVQIAKENEEALSIQFDQGRDAPHLRAMIQSQTAIAEREGRFLSYGFTPVAHVPALQAADLVAHEAYRAFVPLLEDPKSVPRKHALRLFEEPYSGAARWMGRKEIKGAIRELERSLKREGKRAKRGRP